MTREIDRSNVPSPVKYPGGWLKFDQPLIMGVINLTKDSFYAGSRLQETSAVVERILRMKDEGADMVDLGAMSSRPGAELSDPLEELDLLLPVLKGLPADLDLPVSIDTIHARVARDCVENGAAIINDISASNFDDDMISTVVQLGVPYIAMHMKGRPENMQSLSSYERGVSAEVLSFMVNKIRALKAAGIRDVIVDPGFGFAKTIQQNYRLLKDLAAFRILEAPVLAGLSRKSMIWKTLNTVPEEALNGTTAANMIALKNGADILRVHDVKEANECRKIWNAYCSNF